MTHPQGPRTTSWSGTRQSLPTKTRRYILRRDKTCQLNYPQVCVGTPREVDHITPHAEATLLGWTPAQIDHPDNLQAVCPPCHGLKTGAEQARGRARAQAARPKQRPKPTHPGLRT